MACLASFPPSKPLKKFLLAYYQENAEGKEHKDDRESVTATPFEANRSISRNAGGPEGVRRTSAGEHAPHHDTRTEEGSHECSGAGRHSGEVVSRTSATARSQPCRRSNAEGFPFGFISWTRPSRHSLWIRTPW